jgi:hypothetical protein
VYLIQFTLQKVSHTHNDKAHQQANLQMVVWNKSDWYHNSQEKQKSQRWVGVFELVVHFIEFEHNSKLVDRMRLRFTAPTTTHRLWSRYKLMRSWIQRIQVILDKIGCVVHAQLLGHSFQVQQLVNS